MEKKMFYGAKPQIFEKARWLRNNMTVPEKKVWHRLKSKQLLNLRFKAQHPINRYVADFYCHALKLVIEIDGVNHENPNQRELDSVRDAEMKGFGIEVIRFSNIAVETDLNTVIKTIESVAEKRI